MTFVNAFRDGGFAMWWVLGADCAFVVVLGIGLAVTYLLRGSGAKWAAVAGVAACAVLPALLGWGGYAYSMSRVTAAVQYADPEFKALLLEVGTKEAMNNAWFGLGSLGCTVPGVLLAVGVAAMAKPAAKVE